MKKSVFTFIILFFVQFAAGQFSDNYKIKGEYFRGTIIKHDKYLENLAKGPVTGGEIAVEWQSIGKWQKHFNYPYLGVGAVFLNLGNPDMLGYAFALYPYINFPIVRNDMFSLNVKPGAGLSYVTKTFSDFRTAVMNNTLAYEKSNAAIGSHLNVYFSAGVNLEVPLSEKISFTTDFSWNHLSNGMIKAPNSGINMLNAFVGLKYIPRYSARQDYYLRYYYAPDVPKDISVELTASGGVRQRYYRDGGTGTGKTFPIASLAVGVYKPITNTYRMGVGGDFFYDGIYTNGLASGYKREYIAVDELKYKLRFGVSWQNELIIGRLIAGVHAGIYLYNPFKNLEPIDQYRLNGSLPKGLIYSYKADEEVGWFYTRFSAKYMLNKHFYGAIGLKTHLQKAEFVEWGLGYRF